MPKKRPQVVFFYRGRVERASGWLPAFSAVGEGGGALYPWRTKRECQSMARREGKQAVFDWRSWGAGKAGA